MLSLKNDIHSIYFEDHSFQHLTEFLKGFKDKRILILVDENTKKHCLPQLLPIVEKYDPEIIEIQSGELHKNLQTCQFVWNRFLKMQVNRKSLLINLGGGVITDLGGFVASIFKRGIPFIHIPTTLLASVDAAIGGKTGIDYRALKNQLGVFAYSDAIFINPDFFSSLSIQQLKSGFSEMLKHGLISDKNYWNKLNEISDLSAIDWKEFIKNSIQIKSNIVLQDPEEQGVRKVLNFGHTFGHAFESFSLEHHNNPLLHGEAVALGMMAEAELSVKMLGLKESEADEIKTVLREIYPARKFLEENIDELIEFLIQDKKNLNDGINFSLLKKIGEGVVDQICSISDIKKCLVDFIHRDK